jgi:hypothetical protein
MYTKPPGPSKKGLFSQGKKHENQEEKRGKNRISKGRKEKVHGFSQKEIKEK